MIRVTNLPGADLNAACSGLAEARPKDGPSNECRQRTCSLKYDGYTGEINLSPLSSDYHPEISHSTRKAMADLLLSFAS
ncbi:hypothetical protein DVP47_00550 [Yersinia enterocolitica]|nr:hypothetical protein [Yersinia enterocolitica]EKN6285178.1 hypothetical protein [Yersinia enterocolitica]EKN6289376.1 hypothetical protein [Yersinia enterocolitica]EKN6301203.1 hypothetical protein [Yersinia enterocolitica]EKN6302461.1 hypothetical protein [Yersinia enterocolitica]